jgi:hypothetical protein
MGPILQWTVAYGNESIGNIEQSSRGNASALQRTSSQRDGVCRFSMDGGRQEGSSSKRKIGRGVHKVGIDGGE